MENSSNSLTPYPLHEDAFPYRAWAVMITKDPVIFREVVERAVREAPRYHINRIEFHDFVYPPPAPEGFVENVVRYEKFDRLKGVNEWNFESDSVWLKESKTAVTNGQMDTNAAHFREAARLVKDAGLKLNVWYHSLRELPKELVKAYPEILDPDSDFLFEAFEKVLDEFLEKAPEVDAVTLTSLAETRSFTELEGASSQIERMERFYRTAHAVCKRHGRELILRDFGGGDDFWEVAERLPEDIVFMTKWMPSDWERVHLPLNRKLNFARKHRHVLEWDLRGEYLGQGFYPYVNPKHFWINLLNAKLFEPEGCVGRIHWTDWRGKQQEWTSLFDAPNGLNAHVFSRALCENGRHRDPEILPGVQGELLPYHWIREWIVETYGPDAWPDLYEVFKETPRLVEAMTICADRYHSSHSFIYCLPHPLHIANVKAMLGEAGRDYIRSGKQWVRRRAEALREIVAAIPIEPVERKEEVLRSFDILAVFARLHELWLLQIADLIEWKENGAENPEVILRGVDATIAETRTIIDDLGGGMAKMLDERFALDLPQLKEWIRSGGTSPLSL